MCRCPSSSRCREIRGTADGVVARGRTPALVDRRPTTQQDGRSAPRRHPLQVTQGGTGRRDHHPGDRVLLEQPETGLLAFRVLVAARDGEHDALGSEVVLHAARGDAEVRVVEIQDDQRDDLLVAAGQRAGQSARHETELVHRRLDPAPAFGGDLVGAVEVVRHRAQRHAGQDRDVSHARLALLDCHRPALPPSRGSVSRDVGRGPTGHEPSVRPRRGPDSVRHRRARRPADGKIR